MDTIKSAREVNIGTIYEVTDETAELMRASNAGTPEQNEWFRKHFEGYLLITGEVTEIDTLHVEVVVVNSNGEPVAENFDDHVVWVERFNSSYGHVNYDNVLSKALTEGFDLTI